MVDKQLCGKEFLLTSVIKKFLVDQKVIVTIKCGLPLDHEGEHTARAIGTFAGADHNALVTF